MGGRGKDVDMEALTFRIEQLQRERDELRKDIEQLCMQQAGPAYLTLATEMHFQRTANLEEDIETLQKRLAACLRDKHSLQEKLTEAYQIKRQMADLHGAELVKNKEAEKQVKFFQNCVAAAFAERDQSVMECEKAKEKEEIASTKLIVMEKSMGDLQSLYLKEKNLNKELQAELNDLKIQMNPWAEVVMKFYEIREKEMVSSLGTSLDEKCICLLNDSQNNWMYYSEDSETSTSKYIASLEDEREALKNTIDKLQNNLRMGLEIEHHFRRNIQSLEKKQKLREDLIKDRLGSLREFCGNMRIEITKILEDEESHIKANVVEFLDKLNQTQVKGRSTIIPFIDEPQNDDMKYKDVHISSRDVAQTSNILPCVSEENMDMSKALAQALQEKVSALLLLSQQEERHLHERNMNTALLKKVEDTQKNLSQVTNEKVKTLMELAKLKQESQLLQEHINQNLTPVSEIIKRTGTSDEGKLKSILKRTYLKKWIGNVIDDNNIHESSKTKEYYVDLARLKVENATLRESMVNMQRVISYVRRLHVTLMKAQDDLKSNTSSIDIIYESLNSVITESNIIKTTLRNVLPISWSVNSSDDTTTYDSFYETLDSADVPRFEKSDPLASAILEMIELLLLAAETVAEMLVDKKGSAD